MAVMAAMSAGVAGRSAGVLMRASFGSCAPKLPEPSRKCKGPRRSRARCLSSFARRLLAVAEQLEHHHEHIDEVQVEVERAHDGGLRGRRRVARDLEIDVLD